MDLMGNNGGSCTGINRAAKANAYASDLLTSWQP
jgi:hypothetical protein